MGADQRASFRLPPVPRRADKPILLGSYASADALDDAGGLLRQPSTFNAAPDVQEPSEVPAPSSSPQQDSGTRPDLSPSPGLAAR